MSIREIANKKRSSLAQSYYQLSQMPEFQAVMYDLERRTIYQPIRKNVTKDVDPLTMAAHMGASELVLHIRGMIERGRNIRST